VTPVFLVARCGSTRLPNKVMLQLGDRTVMEHHLIRSRLASRPDAVIVCTTELPSDDLLAETVVRAGVACYRGDPEDVCRRLQAAAHQFGAEFFVVVEGDELFFEPDHVDQVILAYETTGVDHVALDGLPIGCWMHGVRTEAIDRICELKGSGTSDGWSRYFDIPGLFRNLVLSPHPPLPLFDAGLRMTLDYPEDLEFARAIFGQLYSPGKAVRVREVIELIRQQPGLMAINANLAKEYWANFNQKPIIVGKPGVDGPPPPRDLRQGNRNHIRREDHMKFLVVGLGSMGRRRIRCLKFLGNDDILAFDTREDRRREAQERYGVPVFADIEAAIRQKPDAMIICVPPDLHTQFELLSLDAGISFFAEASVVDDGMETVIDRLRNSNLIGFPSCSMLFFGGPTRAKALVEKGVVGRPLFWTYHSGQYLPDWHPWEKITDYYVSKRAVGGCREIVPFELVWLVDLFGYPSEVAGRVDKISDLGVDIDDVYMLQLRQNGILGQLTVDVLARAAVRHFRLVGSDGTLEWNAECNAVRVLNPRDRKWTSYPLDEGPPEPGYIVPEEPYVEEMREFIRCLETNTPPAYSLEEDLRILRILYAAEESSRRGERIVVRQEAVC